MKLIGSLPSPFTRKARIVAAEKRIDYVWEAQNVWAPDTPVPDYNPLGKVPVLILDDGTALYDSRVICEFLDAVSPIGKLIPADNRERIEVRRWEALADGVLDAGLLVRYESLRPKKEQSETWIEKQLGKAKRGLALMESDLGDRAWCHGERYSLADIAFGCALGWLEFRKPGGLDWRAGHAGLAKHYAKLMERPAFADTAPK